MSWIVGILGVGAVAYVGNKIYETYDYYIQTPINDRIEQINKDLDEKATEELRQEKIRRSKELYTKNNQLRNKYNLPGKKLLTKVINNTDDLCSIVYVSDYNAKNNDEAIIHAKTVLKSRFFNTTRWETIGVNCNIDIIEYEIKEYFVVIGCVDKFIVLDENDFTSEEIRLKNRFNLKSEVGVDIKGCFKDYLII